MNSSFWKSGHTPTLFAAFLYFDLSFMVWYLLGPLAVQIAADLHLSTQQRGLMVATPILAGAVLRFIMGLLADRLSPKTAGLIGQVIVIGALFMAWKLGIHSYEQALLLGVCLGHAEAYPQQQRLLIAVDAQLPGHEQRADDDHLADQAGGLG